MKDQANNIDFENWIKFGGRERVGHFDLHSFDIHLLKFDVRDVHRHIEIHAAAMLYYSTVLEKARRQYNSVSREVKAEFVLLKDKIRTILTKKGEAKQYDVEAYMHRKFSKKVERLNKKLENAEEIMNRFERWYEAWRTKGFLFEYYKGVNFGDIGIRERKKGKKKRRSL